MQKNDAWKKDSSGRRKPVPTDETCELTADTVICAIGEQTDLEILTESGIEPWDDGSLRVDPETLETDVENVFVGGDALRGPSTVVESIADAKRAVTAITGKEWGPDSVISVIGAGGMPRSSRMTKGSDSNTPCPSAKRCQRSSLSPSIQA